MSATMKMLMLTLIYQDRRTEKAGAAGEGEMEQGSRGRSGRTPLLP